MEEFERRLRSTLEKIPTDVWQTHIELQISLATLSVLNERGLVRFRIGGNPDGVYWKRIPKEETE